MKRILKAAAIVGLSSVVVVVLGAVRAKAIALGVGADGTGALGLLTATANVGVVLFGLGLNTSGVQAVAAASDDPVTLRRVRAALLGGSGALAVVGGILCVVAMLVAVGLGLIGEITPLILVALGTTVGAMVISGAQLALINGLGRVRTLALVNSVGAAVGTAVTLVAVLVSQEVGLLAAFAATPVATLIGSTIAVLRMRMVGARLPLRDHLPQLGRMVSLGGIVMAGVLLTNVTQLGIRTWIEARQGLTALGHYQAAWTITSLYMGFILTALAAEYFPRISRISTGDIETLHKGVDIQARVTLLLAMPVLLWTIVLAPVVLVVLYSGEFVTAVALLRWQLLGDVCKVASWAIAFLLLARRAQGSFFVGELVFNLCYAVLVVSIPSDPNMVGIGVAYTVSYAAYLGVISVLAYRSTRFRLSGRTWGLASIGVILAATTVWMMQQGSTLGMVVGVSAAVAGTTLALVSLVRMRRVEQLRESPVAHRIEGE